MEQIIANNNLLLALMLRRRRKIQEKNKSRRFQIHPFFVDRSSKGEFNNIFSQLVKHPEKFQGFLHDFFDN
jgi:hypothetical protein